jgi:hypothetical protein
VADDGTINSTDPIANAGLIEEADKAVLIENAATDVPAVQDSYLAGGRQALIDTAQIPAGMTIGFLFLLIYYKAIGGYKVLDVNGNPIESSHDSGDGGDAPAAPDEGGDAAAGEG